MTQNENLSGYRYVNREESRRREFYVVRSSNSADYAAQVAQQYQKVINEALTYQFSQRHDINVTETADPNNPSKVAAQAERIAESGGTDQPVYFEARCAVLSLVSEGRDLDICGVAKAKYADGRPGWRRRLNWPGDNPGNLADIGDVFVSPNLFLASRNMRGAGIGSALVRSMLDVYPDDMTTVFYDYPELNPRIETLAERYGFHAVTGKSRQVEYCGQVATQVLFQGPAVGELVADMEEQRPWLAKRRPIELRA